MEKKQAQELTNNVIIAEILLKIRAIESILIKKNIFTQEELKNETSELTDGFIKHLLEKANVGGNTDEIFNKLKGTI